MTEIQTRYDAVIVGAGHNGLVAACYLAKAGLDVLLLERNPLIGGATRSSKAFAGFDARISVYSYLISLLPQKIVDDLDLAMTLLSRKTASWTPAIENGRCRDLLIRNGPSETNRRAFLEFTGSRHDYDGYLELQDMQQWIASAVWPTLTTPLITRRTMRNRLDGEARRSWQDLIEEPIGQVIERLISDDWIRGLVMTDGKIGLPTHAHDPTLMQNRCYLYHVIGRGTGEWSVPVGGMGALVDSLVNVALHTGRVTILTQATVRRICPAAGQSTLLFETDANEFEVDADYVLCNASKRVLAQLTNGELQPRPVDVEGTGFKINMLLRRLPRLRSNRCTAAEAFAGTVHIDEGYQQMQASYQASMAGKVPNPPPGEIYCHTLTDSSILSEDLKRRGFHTLTLFGLDMPYRLFEADNDGTRAEVVARYLAGINRHLAEPIEDCLAIDGNGAPCIEAMSAVDLERKIHLPKGNIFHGDITWPFVETEDEAGLWGVETAHPRILLCGSSAKRGGAVSGIPGHNAAMKILHDKGPR